ncbi:MAG: hypothetical protein ABEH35_05030 [Haloarculaceae archaeon]
MDDVVDLVTQSLAEDSAAEFTDRIDEQAAALRTAIENGEFDNDGFAVGLEIEVYAINREPEPPEPDDEEPDDESVEELEEDLSDSSGNAWSGSLEAPEDGDDEPDEEEFTDDDEPYMDPDEWEGKLTRLPEEAFGDAMAKELGLHNAEVNTDPTVFDGTGIEVQTTAVEMQVKKAKELAEAENCTLVLDAMWTIPPDEGTRDYLAATDERDGLVFAENMRRDPRYVAIDNAILAHAGGEIEFDVPGFSGTFPTILFESLTTSIQPHLQIPAAERFPEYYNAAIRTLGPLLSLSTNSPFLPADCYDVADPTSLLEETHHELRIAAFEQSVNTTPNPKVRVPDDIAEASEVVDRVVADDLVAPFLREWIADGKRQEFDDEYWEFDHKRSTFWRWLRCVVGGDPVEGTSDEQSLRIEYRPLPTQPTTDDVIALQVLTAGLIRGLVARDHPITELPWQDAKRSFYSAAHDGPDADLTWVTADGERTTDTAVIYDELFEYARYGLDEQGVPERRANDLLGPMERRREAGTTPSAWKIERVGEYLDDGRDLSGAIEAMQRDYFDLSADERCFADWL